MCGMVATMPSEPVNFCPAADCDLPCGKPPCQLTQGAGHTNCTQLFSGCPELSRSYSRNAFQHRWLSLSGEATYRFLPPFFLPLAAFFAICLVPPFGVVCLSRGPTAPQHRCPPARPACTRSAFASSRTSLGSLSERPTLQHVSKKKGASTKVPHRLLPPRVRPRATASR
jgi:hypothetical protein